MIVLSRKALKRRMSAFPFFQLKRGMAQNAQAIPEGAELTASLWMVPQIGNK